MIVEIGHISAIFAMVLCAIAAGTGIHNFFRPSDCRPVMVIRMSRYIFGAVALSFITLIWAYLSSDFTVLNVIENSHTLKPWLYKISGAWGNHEGSVLFWIFVLTAYGFAFSISSRHLEPAHRSMILSIQCAIGFCFLLFMLATSNPFERVFPPPADGQDLNPLLQDPGLAFHPPFLYLGYVGYALIFGFAATALMYPQNAKSILAAMRPWALIAWAFLTAGITLGSYWAYYELGWGGWWFWDPVENASLMPWLIGTALLHSVMISKRGGLMHWTILLALFGFCFSLLGTFLVRSGIITSVHAFANDPGRGVFLLLIMGIIVMGVLLIYALRARHIQSQLRFGLLSREMSIMLNSMILAVLCFTVFLGTLYPLFIELWNGHKLSVGTPYFSLTFIPLSVPLIVIMAFAPSLAWGQTPARKLWGGLLIAAIIAMTLFIPESRIFWILLAAWVIVASLYGLLRQWRIHGAWRGIPKSTYGFSIGHLGLGLSILGMAGSSLWLAEDTIRLQINKSFDIAGYHVVLEKIDDGLFSNYAFVRAKLRIENADGFVDYLYPEKRFYPVKSMPTTESARHVAWHGDLYTSLLDFSADKSEATLRIANKPLVIWIWIGGLLVACTGLWRGIDLLPRANDTSLALPAISVVKPMAGALALSLVLYLLWGAPFFLIYG